MLPFAPTTDRWTDLHYDVYSIAELILGNRKEVTEEEMADMDAAKRAEAAMLSGEADWREILEEHFQEGGDLDDLPIDNIARLIEEEEG